MRTMAEGTEKKIELRPRDESVDCNVCGQPTKERQRASI